MFSLIVWCAGGVLLVAWIFLIIKARGYHSIWKTKKDFSFNDLDKILEQQDYKFEVNKYLHKYKSDRRWYENRMVKTWVAIFILTLLLAADAIIIVVKRCY